MIDDDIWYEMSWMGQKITVELQYTGSSRINVKSKSVCTGVNFHKEFFVMKINARANSFAFDIHSG